MPTIYLHGQELSDNAQTALIAFRRASYVDAWSSSRASGISNDEIQLGREVADIERDVRSIMEGIYGNPAYGAWPAEAEKTRIGLLSHKGVVINA